VNGAQTVSTLGSVLGTDFEANLSRAFVLVRCVEVSAENADLGNRITRFANTQMRFLVKTSRFSIKRSIA
jgi:hypothetical protein